MPSKCVLILLDGLGDRSFASLDDLTPLQAAHTPTLDRMASLGANGLYHAGTPGQALPSENAHFALFGYEMADFPGRGALEALGTGVDLHPGDVAVLAHLVSLRPDRGRALLVQDLPETTAEEARDLLRAVQRMDLDGTEAILHPERGLFGLLVLRNDTHPLSPRITDSNPMRDGSSLSEIVPLEGHRHDPSAQRTAGAMTSFLRRAHAVLSAHPRNAGRRRRGLPPVNGIVTQRAGQLRTRPASFTSRFGLRGLSIASGTVFRGLADLLGMHFLPLEETENPEADMVLRLERARRALTDHDFVHVHTKAPDVAAHRKDPEGKRLVIEALDRGIAKAIGPLLDDPDVLVAVTADHSTPSGGNLVHSGEPVPLLFCGQGVRRDAVDRFDEVSAATGALGPVRGTEFMDLVLNGLDMARLEGIRDTPGDCRFWPGKYRPFLLDDNDGSDHGS